MEKKQILIIMGRYLPGYKDGGPVRSIKNLTDYLGEEYDFHILTCDRDHGDVSTYKGITVREWNQQGNAAVYYVEPGGFTKETILFVSKGMDLIYVCGCFNDYAINTLILKRLGKISVPVFVAAMGLFSPKEFHLKYWKKKPFIMVFNALGLFKNIYWSATSEMEIGEILQQVRGSRKQFFIAEDLPRMVDASVISKKKRMGEIDIVWISRIAPKKNLLRAIEILQQVKCNVHFSIYGPVHVQEYWQKCKEALDSLPKNVTYDYYGNVDSEQVVNTLRKHHLFLFPTLGENYGHVIQEALSAGCPCVLSDQTPWLDLESQGVGYVYSLNETQKYVQSIENYAAMDEEEWNRLANHTVQYVASLCNEKVQNTGYRDIFEFISD